MRVRVQGVIEPDEGPSAVHEVAELEHRDLSGPAAGYSYEPCGRSRRPPHEQQPP